MELLTLITNTDNILSFSTHICNREDWSVDALDEIAGIGNWVITPSDDLPADFSVESYTIVDGALVPASAEIIASRLAIKQAQDSAAEIARLRDYLTSTDYAAIKCGELGLAMSSEYPELHAERTAARARINELQKGEKDA